MINVRKLFARRNKGPLRGEQAGLWNAIFEEAEFLSTAPRRIQEVQGQMINRLGRVYQMYDRLGRQYSALLEGIIRVADFCEGLMAEAPSDGAEGVQAIHRALMDLLEGHGVRRWECQPGDVVFEGCEVVGYSERGDLEEGVIGGVIAPGYRLAGGEVFRRARVLVNRKPVAPEPAPAAPSEPAAGEAPAEARELPPISPSPGVTVEEGSAPAGEAAQKAAPESPPKAAEPAAQAAPKSKPRSRNPKHRKGASR